MDIIYKYYRDLLSCLGFGPRSQRPAHIALALVFRVLVLVDIYLHTVSCMHGLIYECVMLFFSSKLCSCVCILLFQDVLMCVYTPEVYIRKHTHKHIHTHTHMSVSCCLLPSCKYVCVYFLKYDTSFPCEILNDIF
jgi:hypothetical protein